MDTFYGQSWVEAKIKGVKQTGSSSLFYFDIYVYIVFPDT